MAEQTFKSPGYFEKEIDLTAREVGISGTPAGIIGTSKQGPAFIPVTVGSFSDFSNRFGGLDADYFGPYAVNEWLKNRTAVTYVRVLGAGANETSGDISNTETLGTVKNAGFRIKGAAADSHNAKTGTKYQAGAVQFIVANHEIHESSQESTAYPIFTDNDSFGAGQANIVRGMVFLASGTRMQIVDGDAAYSHIVGITNELTTGSIKEYDGSKDQGTFKIILSSSAGSGFNTSDDGYVGIKEIVASLDPKSDNYIDKVLNTDPKNFQTEEHLLYASFPVESQIARVKRDASNGTVSILSGSADFTDKFGRFDTRYSNAKTTSFISQPFGKKEYDLFHFETLDDGDLSNRKVKISISNLKRSSDPLNPYGTFDIEVRNYYDNDLAPQIVEQFNGCNLNPNDENYVGRKVGDMKAYYNFDASTPDERRIVTTGKYRNNSRYVRIVMNSSVTNKDIPKSTLPFGFRGMPSIVTNESLADEPTGNERLRGNFDELNDSVKAMSGSIVPPVPMTIKVTRGAVKEGGFFGQQGDSEVADSRIYWGIKTTKLASSASLAKAALYTNAGGEHNELIDSYTKLLGIQKLNMLTTGSSSDTFNNNKFTLSKIGFYNQTNIGDLTGSAEEHIVEAAYIRNSVPNSNTYTVSDGSLTDRLSFGTLVSNTDAKYFNRFSKYMKFTNVFQGGFDGVNILDTDLRRMNYKATETLTGGKGNGSSESSYYGLNSAASPGTGLSNNYVASYRAAIRILTDEMSSRVNIVSIPGIRTDFVTDYAAERTQEYGKAIYLMDIPFYDGDGNIIFDESSSIPDVRETSETFDGRSFDNNFVASYFPDVTIQDEENNGRYIKVPASIAALGAIGYTDSISYPWFAPAGFNRGSLDFVLNTQAKLTANDRDTLYEARINPITSFPNSGFVIFGQKTLQYAKSSLDRVNVRRMLLEVRRLVEEVAVKIVFEQNNQATRNRFISLVTPLLSNIQTQKGIDAFRVVMDDSNNTPEDAEQNRLNGRIVLVPTRAIEFIAIDFIITNAGVSFE